MYVEARVSFVPEQGCCVGEIGHFIRCLSYESINGSRNCSFHSIVYSTSISTMLTCAIRLLCMVVDALRVLRWFRCCLMPEALHHHSRLQGHHHDKTSDLMAITGVFSVSRSYRCSYILFVCLLSAIDDVVVVLLLGSCDL